MLHNKMQYYDQKTQILQGRMWASAIRGYPETMKKERPHPARL